MATDFERLFEEQRAAIGLVWGEDVDSDDPLDIRHAKLCKFWGYDGAKFEAPDCPQFLPVDGFVQRLTDRSLLYSYLWYGQFFHLATGQLEWAIENSPWVLWAMYPTAVQLEKPPLLGGEIAEALRGVLGGSGKDKDFEPTANPVALRARAFRGAIEFLKYWWFKVDETAAGPKLRDAFSTVHACIEEKEGRPVGVHKVFSTLAENAVAIVEDPGNEMYQAVCAWSPAAKDIFIRGGMFQDIERQRFHSAGWPYHLDKGAMGKTHVYICFGDIKVHRLSTSKEEGRDISVVDIVDDEGSLLPYEDAIEQLEEKYNDFEDEEDFREFITELDADLGSRMVRAFEEFYDREFSDRTLFSDGEVEKCWYETFDYDSFDLEPLQLKFSVGFEEYKALFFGGLGETTVGMLMDSIAAQRVFDAYDDYAAHCWLVYRDILAKDSDMTKIQPFSGLSEGMQKDFIAWCREVPEVDGWQHEISSYNGKGHTVHLAIDGENCGFAYWRER